MEIVSVSGHALERFREHEAEADAHAVLLAARMAIPIGSELAQMIVGRPRRAAEARDHALHRVHLSGAGIFVLCPLLASPGQHYVKTYLRLASVVQREMVDRWFLHGVSPVTVAFELGFRAGREAPACVTEGEAVEAHGAELLRLAAHHGAQRARETASTADTIPEAQPSPAGGPAPTLDSTPSCLAPTRPPVAGRGVTLKPDAVVDGVGWTTAALEHRAWFLRLDANWEVDLTKWRVLSFAEQSVLRESAHFGPMGPATSIWLEPDGRAVALVADDGADMLVVHRLSTLPRAVRERFGLPAKPSVRRRPVPVTPPSPAPGAASAGVPAEPALDRLLVFLDAASVRVSHWTTRARQDARTAGLSEIPAPWLTCLEPVPVAACAALGRAIGWSLGADRRYAMRRGTGYVVLLADTGRDGRFAVARCARDPEG